MSYISQISQNVSKYYQSFSFSLVKAKYKNEICQAVAFTAISYLLLEILRIRAWKLNLAMLNKEKEPVNQLNNCIQRAQFDAKHDYLAIIEPPCRSRFLYFCIPSFFSRPVYREITQAQEKLVPQNDRDKYLKKACIYKFISGMERGVLTSFIQDNGTCDLDKPKQVSLKKVLALLFFINDPDILLHCLDKGISYNYSDIRSLFQANKSFFPLEVSKDREAFLKALEKMNLENTSDALQTSFNEDFLSVNASLSTYLPLVHLGLFHTSKSISKDDINALWNLIDADTIKVITRNLAGKNLGTIIEKFISDLKKSEVLSLEKYSKVERNVLNILIAVMCYQPEKYCHFFSPDSPERKLYDQIKVACPEQESFFGKQALLYSQSLYPEAYTDKIVKSYNQKFAS